MWLQSFKENLYRGIKEGIIHHKYIIKNKSETDVVYRESER